MKLFTRRSKKPKVLIALRLPKSTVAFIKSEARRERITQARVVEIALKVNGNAVKFNLRPKTGSQPISTGATPVVNQR